MSVLTHTHAFTDPWVLKFDELRDSKQWTALGPEGRIGDFEEKREALGAMELAMGDGRWALLGAWPVVEPWGKWWSIHWSVLYECKVGGCATKCRRWMRVCDEHDHRQCQSGKVNADIGNERCRNVISDGERLCHLHGHRDTFEEERCDS